MTDLKVSVSVADATEQLRLRLEGIESCAKLDDYLIDDECGGFIRTLLYKDSLIGAKFEVLTVTLDNLMGYTRVHAASHGKKGGAMEHSLREELSDVLL